MMFGLSGGVVVVLQDEMNSPEKMRSKIHGIRLLIGMMKNVILMSTCLIAGVRMI